LKNLFFGSLPEDISKLSKSESKKKQIDFENMVQANCNFLYTTYPDIFKRMMKDELDLKIMVRLIEVLKMIEDNKTDQHEASVLFGRVLKEMYIDSAIRHADNLDLEHKGEKQAPEIGKNISWAEYKKSSL
jgi:DNA-binding ferritin-like protein (Dps family)